MQIGFVNVENHMEVAETSDPIKIEDNNLMRGTWLSLVLLTH